MYESFGTSIGFSYNFEFSAKDLPPKSRLFLRLSLQAQLLRVDLNLKGARRHDASYQMCGCWRRVCNQF